VCICCGEEMSERSLTLSRNPNICASCSSLADGMEGLPPIPGVIELPPADAPDPAEEKVIELRPALPEKSAAAGG
jgi:hypothetical protein